MTGWERVVENLTARVTGPMHFRLLLQPATAIFLGARDGIKDAKEGRPPYFWTLCTRHFWTLCTRRNTRWELLRSGIRAVAKVMIMAVIIDAIYQAVVLHWFYPGEAVLVALVLAFLPYLLIRGPVRRIASLWASRRQTQGRIRSVHL